LAYEEQKGRIYRREWTNLLFDPSPNPPHDPEIYHHDIRRPLPFADETFDAAYALHIVEHLTPDEAARFVREIHRVLQPGAIVRISTPDLEDICRNYLHQLDQWRSEGSPRSMVRYRWSVYELLDQIVREQSGGLMAKAAATGDYDREFALQRFGDVFDEFSAKPTEFTLPAARGYRDRLLALRPSSLWAGIAWRLRLLRNTRAERRRLDYARDPRRTAELNKWMYDEVSLNLLLRAAGFEECHRHTFRSSGIPRWERYALDRSCHGDHAIEPSLYMEARKRSTAACAN
jgi:SAM-dependent methyltransferase